MWQWRWCSNSEIITPLMHCSTILSPSRPGVKPRPVCVAGMLEKVAMGQVSEYFGFLPSVQLHQCSILIPLSIRCHIMPATDCNNAKSHMRDTSSCVSVISASQLCSPSSFSSAAGSPPRSLHTTTSTIQGMTCAYCVLTLTKWPPPPS